MHPLVREGMYCCAGWIFGRDTTRCCAVRVRGVGPTGHAVFGLPRPDVAAAFPHEPQAAYSGFCVTLRHASHEPVRLEWMDAAGCWHEFWRGPGADKDSPAIRNPPPTLPLDLTAALGAATLAETKNLSWRNAWRKSGELAEAFTSESTQLPLDPDVLVTLDQPAGAVFSGRLLPIGGWIIHRRSPIRRIFAHAEPGGLAHVIFPHPRADVVAAYPDFPMPLHCGFDGMILLPVNPPVWFELRLYAECADGSTALVVSSRFFRQPAANDKPSNLRSTILLQARAFAGSYQPESWSHWSREILPRRRHGPSAPEPARPGVVVEKAKSVGGEPDPTLFIEPRESDPLISILVPVYNPPERYLREMIASVQTQSYPRWELCLADDASTEPHVRRVLTEFARSDGRVRPVYRAENGHISRASNSALAHATGEFVALLDHDDRLAPGVLLRIVEAIRVQPSARFIYTNRDKIDDEGRHFDAENRGDWNPAAAITHNYLHHLTVIGRNIVLQAGAFRPEYFGSQDLDLYLRCHELIQPEQIVHVPMIGYHWRAHAGSTASRGDQKDYMFDSARRGIEDALRRRGLRAKPFLPDFGAIYGMNLHQLHWDPEILREQSVSIVVAVPAPQIELWPQCLAQMRTTIPPACAQFIVVSAKIPAYNQSLYRNMEFVAASADAPLAELFNLGTAQARHPLLLLVEAGVSPEQSGWLEDLAGWLSVSGVVAAGPKLIAADGRLASAAWTINPETRLPQALCAGDPVNEIKAPYLSLSARDALLLDPACVLTYTKVFRELGGYDSHRFPVHYFTADYCLRLKNSGRRVVFSPQAVLNADQSLEIESPAPTVAEDNAFQEKHPDCVDPWIRPATPNPPDNWMPSATIEFAGGWFFLEQPFPGEEIHAGHQVLSGWCLPRTGKNITDLRVRFDRQTRPVDLGHPRSDLAARTGANGRFFPVGFSLELALSPGRTSLEFEALIVGVGWRQICTVELAVLPTLAKSRPASTTGVTLNHFADAQELLLKQFVDEPNVSLKKRAAAFARDLPLLATKRYAANPFHGFIDSPTPHIVPMYGGAIVSGWLIHETLTIRRVAASYDLTSWLELEHEKESPKISAQFPHIPSAAHCGIYGFVTLPPDVSRPLPLRIWAELADGSWRLVFVVRSRIHALTAADLSLLLGVDTWTLWRTAWALQLAFFRERSDGPGRFALWSAVQEIRRGLPAPERRKNILAPLPLTPGRFVASHLLLVSHNLNREGAPMFLLELARHCLEHTATRLTVVSPFDGSLRSDFEQLGAEVRIVDRDPLWSARTPQESAKALDELSRVLQPHTASLVVANTIESFWAVTLARRTGRPSLFYIHEPGVLGFHYVAQPASHLRRAAATALAEATCVSFTNHATQAYYIAYSSGANYRIQPGWAGQFPPGTLPAPSVRTRLRARLGFAAQDRVVINVGTLCQRKGQLFFVYAVEQLWRTHPALAATCHFLLIGASDSSYGESLTALINQLGRPNLKLIPPTNKVQEYFGAADLFLLSSFEEGFSRVLLEAMGFGLPIISTSIHGIADIARHEREALLVPTGDVQSMATAMQLLLQDDVLAARLGHSARLRLEATYTATRVLPLHFATITALAPDLIATAPRIPAPGRLEPICAVS